MPARPAGPSRKAGRLFLRHLSPAPDDDVVDLRCADGELAVAVAGRVPRGHLTLLTHDAAVRTELQRGLSEAGPANVTVVVAGHADALPAAGFDLAYLVVRPYLSGADLADLLAGAWRCLRPDGRLVLLAGMRQGAPTVLRRAEAVFGNLQVLDKPGGMRIACCRRGPGAAGAGTAGNKTHDMAPFTCTVRGREFAFCSAGAAFARGGLDEGTRLLLETVEVRQADRVADLGCGYGAIGIVAARLAPAGHVTLVDADARAVDLARRNIARNGVTNAEAIVSDGLAAVGRRRFDLVLSNPPLHAASGVLARLTAEAHARLVPAGRLAYVVHTAYDARPIVKALFGEVAVLAETEAFRVIGATRV